MAVALAEQHFEVRIGGWRYPRHVILRDGQVEMEIARSHCSHCSTCRARILHCQEALRGTQFERRSAGGGEYFVLPYPAEAGRDSESLSAFLAKALNLWVEPA